MIFFFYAWKVTNLKVLSIPERNWNTIPVVNRPKIYEPEQMTKLAFEQLPNMWEKIELYSQQEMMTNDDCVGSLCG